jgi:hypothetical protein
MSVAKLALPARFEPISNATIATKPSRSLHSRPRNAKGVTMRYDTHTHIGLLFDYGTVTRVSRMIADIVPQLQECLSCCNPLAPSSHNIEYDSEKSKVSSKPRVIDVISNRSMSTKASTYAAPSAGTSVIGSDYTSRDGGVRVNSVGSSAPSSSAPSSGGPGSSAQYKSQYLRNSDSDEENDIVAEGYED